jgi:D-alanyl-D-alanine carboxypeptidase/D-alanyl-D-alanine-endopeptidase (penicillin-binding protein 4)
MDLTRATSGGVSDLRPTHRDDTAMDGAREMLGRCGGEHGPGDKTRICGVLVGLVAALVCSMGMAQTVVADSSSLSGSHLGMKIAALVAEPAVVRAHWGVMVTGLDGTPIYGLNEGQLFQPASNAKLYTTAAAMALLGPHQKFTTRVEYRSDGDRGKTVDGNLVIVGAGDGNLNDREFPYRRAAEVKDSPAVEASPLRYLAEFADQIAAAGVRRVKGDVVGDDTVFPWEPYPQDWAIDDMVWGYGAPVSGLTVAENQVRVTVRPGKNASEAASVEWQEGMPAYYRIDATELKTGAAKTGSHVQMDREVGSKVLRIYGSIAVDSPPDGEEIAIADPAEFAAVALKELLEARGVRVDGVARARHRLVTDGIGFIEESRKSIPKLPMEMAAGMSSLLTGKVSCSDACPVILQHTSPEVQDDIVLTNKISQNLHAELLLHHLGKAYGEVYAGGDGGVDGSTAEGARVVRQFWINAGIDKDDFVFFDGSGLSGHDLVTPRATAKLLQYSMGQTWFADWKKSLPVGGEDGSLVARFAKTSMKDRVFAKTGTLGEARALSGYLECASGRTVIFSIMVGNHAPGTNADRDVMDRIVGAIWAAE